MKALKIGSDEKVLEEKLGFENREVEEYTGKKELWSKGTGTEKHEMLSENPLMWLLRNVDGRQCFVGL